MVYGHSVFEGFLSQVCQMDFLHITSQALLQNTPLEQQQYDIPLAVVTWILVSISLIGRN